MTPDVEWLEPTTLDEALRLRAERPDAIPIAGGTFVGTLIGQRLLFPSALLSLGRVDELEGIALADGELRIGAMTRHRAVEQSTTVRADWPALARAFALVASPRVRHQATVGGVLADADYASDPPAMLSALDARVIVDSRARGPRDLAVEELVTGYYETSLEPDELVVGVRVRQPDGRAVYRKFRSRSEEDRPCVSVAAARHGEQLKVVVGAVAGRLQHFPDVCSAGAGRTSGAEATAIGTAYAELIDPIDDARGSRDYRRRIIAVEVRRAIEALDADEA